MQKDFPDDTFLARWLNDELTEAELATLRQREDYETLRRIVAYTDRLEMPPYGEEAAWQKLREQRQKVPKPKVKTRNLLFFVAAAASVALLLGWYFLFRTALKIYETGVGEQITLQLPDRSEVILNAASTLAYDPANWPEERRVKLDGEAYFEVARGAVFTVETGLGKVEIVGTGFNVLSREKTMEVRCYSGKVAVSNASGRDTLEAGRRAIVYTGTAPRLSTFDLSPAPDWTRGWIAFKEGAPLGRVFAELERQYGKKVIFEGASGRIYNGGFPTGDLPAALKFICDPMGLTYEIKGEEILILE